MRTALTWAELADRYDMAHSGRKARTLSMDTVFTWAEQQPQLFTVDKEGFIYETRSQGSHKVSTASH